MILERFYDVPLAQASFLAGCPAAGEAIVIDPNRDIEQYVRAAAKEKVRITGVTETHIHADFVSGARELAERTGARLYLSDEGDAEWKYGYANQKNVTLVRDGDVIRAGAVKLQVMKTPGHTPEHISFVLTDEASTPEPLGVFTGDFVFVGDVGRPDLLERAAHMAGTMEKGAHTLFSSLARFRALPGYLTLWPGHGAGSACGKALGSLPSTTLEYEKFANWGLRTTIESAFVNEVLAGQPEPPVYFKEMKRINRDGPPLLGGFREPPRLPAESLATVLDRGGTVVDLRSSRAYEAGGVPGTLHIPIGSLFTTWAGWLLPYRQPIHLIAPNVEAVMRAVRDLAMIGLDEVAGWFDEQALAAWSSARGPLVKTDVWSPGDTWKRLQSGDITLLDVRGAGEYDAGHPPGVVHIPLGYLAGRIAEVPKGRRVAVFCGGQTRSPIGVSVLRRAGIDNVVDVEGGYNLWTRMSLPLEDARSKVGGPANS